MNYEQMLRQELRAVGDRYRRLLLRVGLSACWAALAVAGIAVLAFARGAGHAVPGAVLIGLVVVPLLVLPLLVRALRTVRNPLWVARRIERRFPDLDARLLAALEQRPEESAGRLNYLQHTVVREAIDHAGAHRWARLVPTYKLSVAQLAQWATLAALAVVLVAIIADMQRRPSTAGWLAGGPAGQAGSFDIKVEPEDTEVERGTGLLVLARFGDADRLPGDVQLLYRTADGETRRMTMSKSLDDPVFAGRVPAVERDLTYAVRYGESQTRWYKAAVFDFPDLKQADARLKFPAYTELGEKLVEDTRSVTAVEGTEARFTFRMNKPLADARLVPSGAAAKDGTASAPAPVAMLAADAADPSLYTLTMNLTQSQRFRLQLVDAQGRRNKGSAELTINVTQNRPPDLKLEWPGRDVDVSPLEELSIRAKAWDDFGLRRVGVSYGLAGRDALEVVLGEGAKAKEPRELAQLVSLEKLAAKPDELLSYFMWAEDVGPDGRVRRTDGDMFFAEVRDFEQIFRQGQAPAGGEPQQKQGGGAAQQAAQLAELQKQAIAATWKLIRRETGGRLTPEFAADATVVKDAQTAAREQAAGLGEQLQDERSKAHLEKVLEHMDEAASQLGNAAAEPSTKPLRPALKSEQAAYQELLKLRAREIEVVRGQRQQQQGSQSGSAQRMQQQLDQLQLDQEENRYEQQRSAAAANPQETAEKRETRQVLNRLRELAQRQEDLNRQMQELRSALEQAEEEAKREEIRRQLERLRDQQQQMLRDTDELRDRMDQPENQQRMAESRGELEQTRENVRKASEALEKGMVPEAAAEGARAGERLNDLRDEFRKAAAGQFNEAMDRMRQEARALDKNQQELSEQLKNLDPAEQQQRALRDGGGRDAVVKGLQEQKEKLDELLEDMRNTVEESEIAEPLLSKKLYDAARDVHQQKTDEALDASRQLLDRGFVEEARQIEGEATTGVTRLREGVERAAESVLGDEAEALRRARDELDALAQELDREIGRRDPAAAAGATTRPGAGGDRRLAGRGPATQPGNGGAGVTPPTSEPSDAELARAGGERPTGGGARRTQEGQRPGEARREDSQQAGAEAGAGQPQQQDRAQPGKQAGQQGESQSAEASGQRQPGGEGEGQPGEASQEGSSGQASARGGGGGLRQREGRSRRGGEGSGGAADAEAGEDLSRLLQGGASGPGGREERAAGPITGEGFRDWADRLRDVEDAVSDPRLRAEAARIRDRAREMRAEYDRHSKEPNWELVREFVSEPLVELRDEVSRELLRRESPEALVPIDREPVSPAYAEQVRRYYERLGGGE